MNRKKLKEKKEVNENEIKDCERRKKKLKKLVDSLNKDFVDYSMEAGGEINPTKIKEMLVKGCSLKRKLIQFVTIIF